jgi:hypothetical protein
MTALAPPEMARLRSARIDGSLGAIPAYGVVGGVAGGFLIRPLP